MILQKDLELLKWRVMKTNNFDVIVLLLTDNCIDIIDRSIQSVLNQSFNPEQIKIVVVDNNSKDGTYEKLINYVKSDNISVYRLAKKYLKTRLMFQANILLQYTLHKYITILNPGDILYPEYIEKCTSILEDSSYLNAKVLFTEVDFHDANGKVSNQVPLFDKSCVLEMKKHFMELFTNGLGHKVQCFYHHGTIANVLVELPHIVDFTDCFKKAIFLLNSDCIYIKNNLACISKTKYVDKIDDLAFRLYFITRLKIYRDTFCNEGTDHLEALNSKEEIYKNLSQLALQYAYESVLENDIPTANNALLFSEMAYEKILFSEFYLTIKNALTNGIHIDSLKKNEILKKSVKTPKNATII